MSEPYPGTQAVLRAIALLKAFSDECPELNLAEISQACNLKRTTTFRLLTALESEGLVTRGLHSDGYRLGPEILVLAGKALRTHDLRQASREGLARLAQLTGEAATLEILVDDQVLILDEVPGRHILGSTPWLGTRWPLHATSTGKVILAYQLPEERLRLVSEPVPALTNKTIVDPSRRTAELDLIRRQGFAVAVDEIEVGFVAVAAPLFQLDGVVTAAISVGGPAIRLTPLVIQKVAGLVKDEAQAISYGLGYRPGNED